MVSQEIDHNLIHCSQLARKFAETRGQINCGLVRVRQTLKLLLLLLIRKAQSGLVHNAAAVQWWKEKEGSERFTYSAVILMMTNKINWRLCIQVVIQLSLYN